MQYFIIVFLPIIVISYQIELYTSEVPATFSQMQLFATLYGERGDSGRRVLAKLSESWTLLESNEVNEFTIHAVDLSQLKMIKLEYDKNTHGKMQSSVKENLCSSTGVFILNF